MSKGGFLEFVDALGLDVDESREWAAQQTDASLQRTIDEAIAEGGIEQVGMRDGKPLYQLTAKGHRRVAELMKSKGHA